MGLLDFLTNEGDKKPVEPAKPAAAGAGTDFFGNSKPADAPAGDSYTVVSGQPLPAPTPIFSVIASPKLPPVILTPW